VWIAPKFCLPLLPFSIEMRYGLCRLLRDYLLCPKHGMSASCTRAGDPNPCSVQSVQEHHMSRLAYLSTVWCRLLGTAWKFTKCVGSWRTRRQHRQHRNCRRICHSNSSQCNKWLKCNCRMACKCHRGCSFRCSSRTCPRLAPTNVAHGLVIKGKAPWFDVSRNQVGCNKLQIVTGDSRFGGQPHIWHCNVTRVTQCEPRGVLLASLDKMQPSHNTETKQRGSPTRQPRQFNQRMSVLQIFIQQSEFPTHRLPTQRTTRNVQRATCNVEGPRNAGGERDGRQAVSLLGAFSISVSAGCRLARRRRM